MGNPVLRLMKTVWVYLNQPLFQDETVMNPFKFSKTYSKQLLERCFTKEHEAEKQRIFLERCWSRSCKTL
ncbi:hypothetical protein C1752_08697 [Acaryochloris thomasi RCC1774]|uniref:Uncharacterized protein n=1 Tax=Acaryochloris thomasi RCC1774 TaxID=1764569 RepID=A0A2W1JIN6_9CYAN|nr:hypothetical protein C1752_08697 [Acaryochloris thomasi RCC1774]